MNQIILATHGGLADGMLDTLGMILGTVQNVHVVSLARDDKTPITVKVQALIDSFDGDDKVYICTDMLGSSVNNEMVALGARNGKLTVIAGMNMPFVIELASAAEPLSRGDLVELIRASREGLRDCSADPVVVVGAAAPSRKSATAAMGGPAKIGLVRLDYRLLHGQVVFSWVTKVNADRIIVVDNEAAGDEVKKGALKLAKPSGVRLNIFTVERALSKMAKLNTLGERVMFVFGNTKELLEFSRSYRFDSVNLGATANHDGAQQIGGKGSSVFLDDAQRSDINELLKLKTKIYVQQTPTYQRVDITSAL
jgi:mannose/fructose/N-acetylgalactosamine-specific phosphotransferase system component IIB/mannose/fructose-specific phosphotransferase system component IIA